MQNDQTQTLQKGDRAFVAPVANQTPSEIDIRVGLESASHAP